MHVQVLRLPHKGLGPLALLRRLRLGRLVSGHVHLEAQLLSHQRRHFHGEPIRVVQFPCHRALEFPIDDGRRPLSFTHFQFKITLAVGQRAAELDLFVVEDHLHAADRLVRQLGKNVTERLLDMGREKGQKPVAILQPKVKTVVGKTHSATKN